MKQNQCYIIETAKVTCSFFHPALFMGIETPTITYSCPTDGIGSMGPMQQMITALCNGISLRSSRVHNAIHSCSMGKMFSHQISSVYESGYCFWMCNIKEWFYSSLVDSVKYLFFSTTSIKVKFSDYFKTHMVMYLPFRSCACQ